MRAYLMTTGVLFALIVVAHLSRIVLESSELATDPAYILITLLAAALSAWAVVLLRRRSSP